MKLKKWVTVNKRKSIIILLLVLLMAIVTGMNFYKKNRVFFYFTFHPNLYSIEEVHEILQEGSFITNSSKIKESPFTITTTCMPNPNGCPKTKILAYMYIIDKYKIEINVNELSRERQDDINLDDKIVDAIIVKNAIISGIDTIEEKKKILKLLKEKGSKIN